MNDQDQNEVTALKDQQSKLQQQWVKTSARAKQPAQDPALFRRWPAAYVDVPAERIKAIEIARSFALVSADLKTSSTLDLDAVKSTLADMREFCLDQFEHANKYADLKWPYTLTGNSRTEEIDTDYFKHKRTISAGALSAVRMAVQSLDCDV